MIPVPRKYWAPGGYTSEMKDESGNGWLLVVFLFDYQLAVWLGQIASHLPLWTRRNWRIMGASYWSAEKHEHDRRSLVAWIPAHRPHLPPLQNQDAVYLSLAPSPPLLFFLHHGISTHPRVLKHQGSDLCGPGSKLRKRMFVLSTLHSRFTTLDSSPKDGKQTEGTHTVSLMAIPRHTLKS